MDNYIRIGTIWKLKDFYKDDYDYGIVLYDIESRETIIELWSKWNSAYNEIHRIGNVDPLDAIVKYIKI